MAGFWGRKTKDEDAGVSADFQRALTHEVMSTELLRIKALIATAVLLSIIVWTVYFIVPEKVSQVWHGNLKPQYLYSVVLPFILFSPVHRAMRISNGVAIVLLFVTGFLLARYAGLRPVRTGMVMVAIRVALVAVTIALGG